MERNREWLVVSINVANYLHDSRFLDPTDPAQQISGLTLDTCIDGDIPVRIEVRKEWSAPARVRWHLWPGEPGRRTWGSMSVRRLSATSAILEAGTYDRSCKRSSRLAKIPVPEAKWGLWMTAFEEHGIETTF